MPVATKSKSELALELGRAMAELRILSRQQIQEKLKGHGINLTFEMLEVMSCLWRKDGIIQQEIADQTLRDKSSMTYLLDNLVKRGLVKRAEDESDRRNKLIYLTADGRDLRKLLFPWAMEVYDVATVDLNEADIENAASVIARMTAALKKG
jgi:DNA-binding MarR family transcriptional regulator